MKFPKHGTGCFNREDDGYISIGTTYVYLQYEIDKWREELKREICKIQLDHQYSKGHELGMLEHYKLFMQELLEEWLK